MSSSHLHPISPPTYAALRARHDEVVTDNLKNRHAAINGWMECHGYSDDTEIENEFGIEYMDRLEVFAGQFARNTQVNLKSLLNRYRSIFFELLEASQFPKGFSNCLKALIVPFEKDLPRLAHDADIALNTLKAWLSGTLPAFSSEEAIGRLEHQLGVHRGTLLNRLPHLRIGKRGYKSGQTAYGRRIQELQQLPFRLELERWPQRAQDQWNTLFRHKTAVLLPKGERRNRRWNIDKRGRCSTAEGRLGWLEDFFGYLVLAPNNAEVKMSGKGLPVEDVDLALLTDTALVNDYLEFLKARSGVYTELCRVFLEFINSLCFADLGWFTQQPALAQHRIIAPQLPRCTLVHGKSVELSSITDQWAEWLAQTCHWIRSNRKTLREKIDKGRTNEPIDPYLADQHPMDILFFLADTMEKHLPDVPPGLKKLALDYRALFLVRFLTANPLRIKMFSVMTYRTDNTGNLRQKKDGTWWLWFAKGEFKNFAGAAQEEYFVPLAPSLKPYIATYIRDHRPVLPGAATCDYLFRPDSRPGLNSNRPMSEESLSTSVLHASQHFIPDCPGFGPHAFRHLIATDLIKNDPVNGHAQAAAALHDKIETVRENYSHLKISDHMKQWNTSHEDKLGRATAGYEDPEIASALEILQEAVSRGIVSVPALIQELQKRPTKAAFFGLR